jgi:hypothetical protein
VSPYTLPNLQLRIISPMQLCGYVAPHNLLYRCNPLVIKQHRVLIIRRIVEDNSWNWAILSLTDWIVSSMPPSPPHSSLLSSLSLKDTSLTHPLP